MFDDYANKPVNVVIGHELEDFVGFSTRLNPLTGYCARAPSPFEGPPNSTHDEDPDGLGDRRLIHAAGLCKFATAPPARGIWVSVFSLKKWVYNPDGMTQWDVVETVRDV